MTFFGFLFTPAIISNFAVRKTFQSQAHPLQVQVVALWLRPGQGPRLTFESWWEAQARDRNGDRINFVEERVCGRRQISPCQVNFASYATFQLLLSNGFTSGRLGREALGTYTWGSTSQTGRRWRSSWSRARRAILSCSTRASSTRFFRWKNDYN